MLEKDLTSFQKLSELEKREVISKFISVFNADEKAYNVLMYHLQLQEERLEANNIKVAKLWADNK